MLYHITTESPHILVKINHANTCFVLILNKHLHFKNEKWKEKIILIVTE